MERKSNKQLLNSLVKNRKLLGGKLLSILLCTLMLLSTLVPITSTINTTGAQAHEDAASTEVILTDGTEGATAPTGTDTPPEIATPGASVPEDTDTDAGTNATADINTTGTDVTQSTDGGGAFQRTPKS